MSRKAPNWIDLRPVRATAIDARGLGLRGPTAMRAFALGAAAFGAVAIGRLTIGRAAIKRLVIEELEVGRLRVRELEVDTERRSQQPLSCRSTTSQSKVGGRSARSRCALR